MPASPLNRRYLIVAGWLAMISAFLTVPWMILMSLSPAGTPGVRAAQLVLLVGGGLIFAVLMLALRKLLHQIHAFTRANLLLTLLVVINCASALVGGCTLLLPKMETSLDPLGLLLLVAMGVLQVLLALRLLSLPDLFRGLHKPFCWLTFGTGLCLTVIVLLPLGMLLSGISDVMLGTIFFQLAADLKLQETAADNGEECR